MSDTREDILEAATKLFLQRGYDGISIKDITEAVGMTKGALYHHFQSKETLFGEVAGRMFSAFRTDFESLPKDSLRGFYRAIVEMRQELLASHRKYESQEAGGQVNYMRILWDAMTVFQAMAHAEMERGDSRERAAWTAMIRHAMKTGEIRSGLKAGAIADLFIVADHGNSLHCLMRNLGHEVPQRLLGHWDAIYEGLKS